MQNSSLYQRVKRFLLGAPRDLFDPKIFHNVSLIVLILFLLIWINLRGQLAHYVEFVKGHGYYAEARYRLGTDVIEVENFFNKLLHNQTAFIAQKKLVFSGHPMIVMPIRVLE